MIRCVSSNQTGFQPIRFKNGLNVVLADRTIEETRQDSRNGLEKSSLVEVIHFCLGSRLQRRNLLKHSALRNWEFSLELEFDGRSLWVSRDTGSQENVKLHGDLPSRFTDESKPHSDRDVVISLEQWKSSLGGLLFGIAELEKIKYPPTARSLMSHFVRRSPEGYLSPFEFHKKQRVVDRQVNHSFLLGLEHSHASSFQELKDKKNAIASLKKLASSGHLGELSGSIGELWARKRRLQKMVDDQDRQLATFRVHPQYNEITKQANDLTVKIQATVREKLNSERLLQLYNHGLDGEMETLTSLESAEASIFEMYKTVGVQLPGLARKRIEEVQSFHRTILANRQEFLKEEVDRIQRDLVELNKRIQELSDKRATLVQVLESHGALEEFTGLQRIQADARTNLNAVNEKIDLLERMNDRMSKQKIELESLVVRANHDLVIRKSMRDLAIDLFNANSQFLYKAPGNLAIDIDRTGFKFNINIERSGSHGIDNMKIFCYDLMLAQLWAERNPSPGFLVHDSTIFDGVDERQVARAIERAASESRKRGFQYICILNSDTLPKDDFSPGFNIEEFVRLRLNDASPSGSLFGVRF